MHDEKNQLSLKRPPSRYEKKILYLKKIERWQKKKKSQTNFRRQNFFDVC